MGNERAIRRVRVRVDESAQVFSFRVPAADTTVRGWVICVVINAINGLGTGFEETGVRKLRKVVGAHGLDVRAWNGAFDEDISVFVEAPAHLGKRRVCWGWMEPAELRAWDVTGVGTEGAGEGDLRAS